MDTSDENTITNSKTKNNSKTNTISNITTATTKKRTIISNGNNNNNKTISKQNQHISIYDKQLYSGGKDLEIISDIQHMFDDMISNHILTEQRTGQNNKSSHHDKIMPSKLLIQLLQRSSPIKVATMCSGTESPILALDMIQNSIRDAVNDIRNSTHHSAGTNNNDDITSSSNSLNSTSSIKYSKDFIRYVESISSSNTETKISNHGTEQLFLPIQHIFSCEIEPFKQAYIERNFQPPILFRDIRELGNDLAYTAYGSLVSVPNTPGCVDLLIAGTSCVDYSNLNNQKVYIQTFHTL